MNDRGLFFFICGATCIWLVLDEFVGKKHLTTFAGLLTPDLSIGSQVKKKLEEAAEAANEAAPSIFFDPNDEKDREKAKKHKGLYEKYKERYGGA